MTIPKASLHYAIAPLFRVNFWRRLLDEQTAFSRHGNLRYGEEFPALPAFLDHNVIPLFGESSAVDIHLNERLLLLTIKTQKTGVNFWRRPSATL